MRRITFIILLVVATVPSLVLLKLNWALLQQRKFTQNRVEALAAEERLLLDDVESGAKRIGKQKKELRAATISRSPRDATSERALGAQILPLEFTDLKELKIQGLSPEWKITPLMSKLLKLNSVELNTIQKTLDRAKTRVEDFEMASMQEIPPDQWNDRVKYIKTVFDFDQSANGSQIEILSAFAIPSMKDDYFSLHAGLRSELTQTLGIERAELLLKWGNLDSLESGFINGAPFASQERTLIFLALKETPEAPEQLALTISEGPAAVTYTPGDKRLPARYQEMLKWFEPSLLQPQIQ